MDWAAALLAAAVCAATELGLVAVVLFEAAVVVAVDGVLELTEVVDISELSIL